MSELNNISLIYERILAFHNAVIFYNIVTFYSSLLGT